MPVRVVSFDVGETLLRPYPGFGRIVLDCCRNEGEAFADDRVPAIEAYADSYFADLRRRGKTFSLSPTQSRRVWTDIYREFLASENVPADRAIFLTERIYATFLAHTSYRLFDDVLPVLRALRDRGFRIGVTSNWESWLPGLLVTTGLSPLLDFQIVSGEVGYEKPDRRIFDAAVTASRVDPSSILHVGDSLASDVRGAVAAGLGAILLDRFDRHASSEWRRIAALHDLLELPELAGPPSF